MLVIVVLRPLDIYQVIPSTVSHSNHTVRRQFHEGSLAAVSADYWIYWTSSVHEFHQKLIKRKRTQNYPQSMFQSKILKKHKMYPPTALRKILCGNSNPNAYICESCTPPGHVEDKSIYCRAFGSFRILLMTAQFGWMHAFANWCPSIF